MDHRPRSRRIKLLGQLNPSTAAEMRAEIAELSDRLDDLVKGARTDRSPGLPRFIGRLTRFSIAFASLNPILRFSATRCLFTARSGLR